MPHTTQDWGEVYIGCAGGGDSVLTLELPTEAPPAGAAGLDLRVHGLMGGHSGETIWGDDKCCTVFASSQGL